MFSHYVTCAMLCVYVKRSSGRLQQIKQVYRRNYLFYRQIVLETNLGTCDKKTHSCGDTRFGAPVLRSQIKKAIYK